ncbi:MAG: helix-turn-helix transcriptional regulator [Fimbriimonadaceae bacterium]
MTESREVHRPGRGALSDREKEIVERAANGLTDKEIAKDLGIATGTVKTHWTRVRTKFRCSTRAQAVALYLGTRAHANSSNGSTAHAQMAPAPETEILGTIRGVVDHRSIVLDIAEMTGLGEAMQPEALIGRPLSHSPSLRQAASAIDVSVAEVLRLGAELRGCVSIEVGRERHRVVFRFSPPDHGVKRLSGLPFLVTLYRYSNQPAL